MNGCSLEAAFPSMGDTPVPGCSSNSSSKEARKEERRRAKKCKGPPVEFLNWNDNDETYEKDPDRQHLNKAPNVPSMNKRTGLREHVPVTAPHGETEPFEDVIGKGFGSANEKTNTNAAYGATQSYESQRARIQVVEESPRNDGNPDGDWSRNTLTITPGQTEQPIGRVPRARFFGAESGDNLENFADYKPNAKNYLLEPDFRSVYNTQSLGKAGSGASPSSQGDVEKLLKNQQALPVPSVSDYWKPLTKLGSQASAFFEKLPLPGGDYDNNSVVTADTSHTSGATVGGNKIILKKLDELFARLDDLQRGGSAEQAQMEVLMFISSGIFLLFAMDLLLRKGTNMRFMRGG